MAKGNIDKVSSDNSYDYQAGDNGKIEVNSEDNGKALYIIVYERKEDGTIKATKCTETTYIYKDIDLGYEVYPISSLLWEKQKNQYHGRAVATGMIPNQIAINRTYAMHIYNLIMSAFPTRIYDANKIDGFSNEIGQQIGVDVKNGESLGNVATVLEGTNVSSQSINLIDAITTFTKECLGINDALLGNIQPDNTSAIKVVQKASTAPLENQKSNLYKWVDGIVKVALDIMGTNYGVRPVVVKVKDANGKDVKKVIMFDFDKLKNIYLICKTEIGQSSYFSEDALAAELTNLYDRGIITAKQLLERWNGSIPDLDGLIEELNQMAGIGQEENPAMVTEEEANAMAQYVDTLEPEIQAELERLPDGERTTTVRQMMAQDPQANGQAQQMQATDNLNQAVSQIV
jgi:hypothetical protein